MILTIHRGSHEIGGYCVELKAGGARILIDLGSPLSNEKVVIPENLKSVDAVLVSHPHGDHYGLIDQLPDSVPVHLGRLSQDFMQASRVFNKHPPLKNTFVPFENKKPFHIAGFKITPHLMDHSSSDAFAFLVEADGKRLFYTGDFRAHGRKAKLFSAMLKRPLTDIDVMLMEGTMIGREKGGFPDEDSVETALIKLMKERKDLLILMTSSQNIDRLVSAYRACVRSERILVVDIYTAWILRKMNDFSKKKATPDISWEKVKVLSRSDISKGHRVTLIKYSEIFGEFYMDLYDRNNIIYESEISAYSCSCLFVLVAIITLIQNFISPMSKCS